MIYEQSLNTINREKSMLALVWVHGSVLRDAAVRMASIHLPH